MAEDAEEAGLAADKERAGGGPRARRSRKRRGEAAWTVRIGRFAKQRRAEP
ncbi:hypothetical protein B2K_40300 [Paenibacillus mucilaginosus K02]|uniref:Uncharacterized protein n=1 Tax=Paenibacillus mucilaginosus K02 TaxID=997761 RepID=R9ULZ2_9BACL|nr:hypothetical protein B2K_40300 [Paenibacillus mucilaginosus K02]